MKKNISNFRSFNIALFNYMWGDVTKCIEILPITYFRKLPKKFIRRSLWSLTEEKGKLHGDFMFLHLF